MEANINTEFTRSICTHFSYFTNEIFPYSYIGLSISPYIGLSISPCLHISDYPYYPILPHIRLSILSYIRLSIFPIFLYQIIHITYLPISDYPYFPIFPHQIVHITLYYHISDYPYFPIVLYYHGLSNPLYNGNCGNCGAPVYPLPNITISTAVDISIMRSWNGLCTFT